MIVCAVNTVVILDVNSGILVALTEFLFSGVRVKCIKLITNNEEGYSALNANSNKILRGWFYDSPLKKSEIILTIDIISKLIYFVLSGEKKLYEVICIKVCKDIITHILQ